MASTTTKISTKIFHFPTGLRRGGDPDPFVVKDYKKGLFFTTSLTCCAVAFKNLLNLRILSAEMEKMSHHLMLQSPTFFFKYAVKNCSQHIHKNAVKVIWMSENCLLANCTYCQCHYEEKALNRCCKDFHNNSNLSSTFKNITNFFWQFWSKKVILFQIKS